MHHLAYFLWYLCITFNSYTHGVAHLSWVRAKFYYTPTNLSFKDSFKHSFKCKERVFTFAHAKSEDWGLSFIISLAQLSERFHLDQWGSQLWERDSQFDPQNSRPLSQSKICRQSWAAWKCFVCCVFCFCSLSLKLIVIGLCWRSRWFHAWDCQDILSKDLESHQIFWTFTDKISLKVFSVLYLAIMGLPPKLNHI